MNGARTILVLAVLLAAPSARADEVEDAATAAAESAASLALNPLAALDKGALDGFRDLPLFTPSRTRPVPPPAPEPVVEAPPPEKEPEPEPPAEPPTLTLSGIAQGPEGAVAFVSKEGEAVEQVRLGDDVDGWLVTSIEPDALKLTLDDREQEYRLFVRSEADKTSEGSGDDETSSGAGQEADPDEPSTSVDELPHKVQRRPPPQQQQQRAIQQQNMTIRRQQMR